VSKFSEYGKLSKKKTDDLISGARIGIDETKNDPLDFALWKFADTEPMWPSPWGNGRPGWHIECSAMSLRYLGEEFEIHGGGRDLVFPHHENEIAQSEGAFDCPFARYWIHNGFLNINQEKMSKSLGNIYTIREILERYEAATLRYYFLGSHYRSPIDFFDQGLEDAEKSMERIYETMDRLDRLVPANGGTIPDEAVLDEFRREMDEDFNTPRALAFIFDEIHALNRRLDEGKTAGLSARVLAMKSAGEVLGLFQEKAELFLRRKRERWMRNHGLSAQAIEELIQRRDRARSAKQWQEADRIRAELQERGITLEDTPGGTIWKVR